MKKLKTYKQLFETNENSYIFDTFFINDNYGKYKYAYDYLEEVENIEKIKYQGETLLEVALYEDHPILAKLLIEKGADVNCDDCLHNAVNYMHYDLIKLMIEKGAKIINRVVYSDDYDYDINILENAICKTSDDWRIVDLLLENGAKLTDGGFETIYDITEEEEEGSWVKKIPELRKRFGNMLDNFLLTLDLDKFNI